MTTRVIIVDDQAMVRAGFAALLSAQSDIDVVGEAPDGAQGVELCRRTHPDVVLMDVRMPEMDGLEAARKLLDPGSAGGSAHRPRVLMLTTFDVDDYVYEALRAGASGFLLKDAPPADLIAAVRANNVQAIFAEAQFNDDLVQTIANETGATVVASLYTDSVGDPPRDTYEGLMRWNIDQVVAALGG